MSLTIDFVGHSTLVVEIDGVRLLTDPATRARIGPLRRVEPVPVRRQLSGIDAVLVSHLHWDHLDVPSLRDLGSRVPVDLRVFLTAAVIVDDLVGIGVVAVFYSDKLVPGYLAAAAVVTALLTGLNRWGVYRALPYAVLGVVLWVFLHDAGLHAYPTFLQVELQDARHVARDVHDDPVAQRLAVGAGAAAARAQLQVPEGLAVGQLERCRDVRLVLGEYHGQRNQLIHRVVRRADEA